MSGISKSEILNLSVPERIQLAEDIWDSVVEFPDEIELSDADKKELDNRLEEYYQNPSAGSPWETVKQKLRKPE